MRKLQKEGSQSWSQKFASERRLNEASNPTLDEQNAQTSIRKRKAEGRNLTFEKGYGDC